MKNLTKVLCMLLALTMVFALAACTTTPSESSTTPESSDVESSTEETSTDESSEDNELDLDDLLPTEGDEVEGVDEYTIASRTLYKEELGDFYKAYMAASAEEDTSMRYALMAIAEAKLMESAVMLPSTANGGNYAIGRVAPYTVTPVLWGTDSDRYHQVIATTEFIKSSERDEMKAKWAELKGTGTYESWVKEYLTGKGYTITDKYTLGYSSDPNTWDALATSRAADSEAIVNTYDGLVEYDTEGVLQPALAESWTVSDDGLTYTFKLREGVVWVDSQGRKVADLTADDFVAGMQHMLDAEGGLEWLIDGKIVGVTEYLAGEITDMEEVGVKAVDTYTVEYTLTAPCSYFLTMLGYNLFAPMSRTYFESKGGKFGEEFDATADSYTYGTSPENIAYCGPYIVTNATATNTIVFQANESYWNKDNINIHTITWLYNDGSDVLKSYNDCKAGIITSTGLGSSALEVCKQDGYFEEYVYTTSAGSTSYMGFFNINRAAYSNVNDGAVASTMTDSDKDRANTAYQNVHFRRAVSFAIDRATFNEQSVGEALKYVSIRNSYTPGTFVSLESEVTVDINGTATTYPAGTYYGKIMQDQIDADGVAIKVWDPDADSGIGSGDGYDGWYNVEEAVKELQIAIEELAAEGVEVSAENPIYLDYCVYTPSATYTNKAAVLKKSIEEALGGCVIVNLNSCATASEWYYAGYYTDYGYEANYSYYDLSGWGPDYGDPSTYLDTFLPEYAGYMIKCIGLY